MTKRIYLLLTSKIQDNTSITKHFIPEKITAHFVDFLNRADENTTSELRRRCNAFFMELVSIFCFDDSASKDLEQEAIFLLMRYVIGRQSTQTKDFSPFPDYGIDPTPVVRSFLLQQLLRSR